jgi:integrase
MKKPRRQAKNQIQNDKHLSIVRNKNGIFTGWRFTPGPSLRAIGLKPQMLKYQDGSFMNQNDARQERDRIIKSLETIAAPIMPKPIIIPQIKSLGRLCQMHDADLEIKVKLNKKSKDTLRFYKTQSKAWLEYAGEDCPVTDFTKMDIIEACEIWVTEGVSISTMNARFRALQGRLAHAERIGWINQNPALRLKIERAEPRRRRASDFELLALVNMADYMGQNENPIYHHIGTAIIAATWTAQRQADLLQCDLGTQLIETAGRKRIAFKTNKTKAKVGPPLMPPLANRLNGREYGPLIPGPFQTFWNLNTFRHEFAKVRARAAELIQDQAQKESLLNLEFRDLRDTAITRLYQAGNTAIQIASWSGHSLQSVNQILVHYIDPQQETADETGDRLQKWADARNIKI